MAEAGLGADAKGRGDSAARAAQHLAAVYDAGAAARPEDEDSALVFDPGSLSLTDGATGVRAKFLDHGRHKLVYVHPRHPERVVKVFYSQRDGRLRRLSSRVRMFFETRAMKHLSRNKESPRLVSYGLTANGFPYQVTDRVLGQSLSDIVPAGTRPGRGVAARVAGLRRRLAASGTVVYDLGPGNIMLGATASDPKPRAYITDAEKIQTNLWLAGVGSRVEGLLQRLSLITPPRSDEKPLFIDAAAQVESARRWRARTPWLTRVKDAAAAQKEKFDKNPPLTAPSFAMVGAANLSAMAALKSPTAGLLVAGAAAALSATPDFREYYRRYIKEWVGGKMCGFKFTGARFDLGKTSVGAAVRMTALHLAAVPLYVSGVRFQGPGPFELIGAGLFGIPAAAYLLSIMKSGGEKAPSSMAPVVGKAAVAAVAAGAVGLSILAYDMPGLGLAVVGGGLAVSAVRAVARRIFGGRAGAKAPWKAEDVVYWLGVATTAASVFGPLKGNGALYQTGLVLGLGSALWTLMAPHVLRWRERGVSAKNFFRAGTLRKLLP